MGLLLAAPLAADIPPASGSPSPSAAAAAAAPSPADQLQEIIVQTSEPRFVAPTRRDRIGRIWAPVLIDGKGPYRLVLDTGANRSAITTRTALSLGEYPPADGAHTLVTGFTGAAMVPTVHVDKVEVGDLLMGATDLPVLQDVFGGAQGVLGIEGLANKRIYADFTHDKLVISQSHGERARMGFTVVPLREVHGGLLVADVRVGTCAPRRSSTPAPRARSATWRCARRSCADPPRNAARQDIIGVTLDVQTGDDIALPDIDFGHLNVQGVHVVFGDMYLFQHWKMTDEPTLTLGMDLLGSFDILIIDYNRHELQIRPREAPGPIS